MAVIAADLTAPTGELQTAWFGDLPGDLAVWIPLGVAQVPSGATTEQADRVVTAYAYWRGFKDVLLRAAGDPNSLSIDKGDISISFTDGQRKIFAAQVTLWEDALNAAIGEVEEPVAVIDNAPRVSYGQAVARAF